MQPQPYLYAGGPPGADTPGANANDRLEIECLTSAAPNPAQVAALYRAVMRDKGYQAFPLGQECAEYLRSKRRRLTEDSFNAYESVLDKLARFYPDLEGVAAFEPPAGTRLVEELMEGEWAHIANSSFNRNLSILRDFFKWARRTGRLQGDPTLAIDRAPKRDVHRETFNEDMVRMILAGNANLRDRIALRLLLYYALRKGTLRAVQFKHFDHRRRRLTVFLKGARVETLPIPEPEFWEDLGLLLLELEANPSDYLMCRQRKTPTGGIRRFPGEPMGGHALHDWWYRCLAAAGLVPVGTTSGERMHKARHTAGQRVLDATGNIVAAQKLLKHKQMSTTANSYVDWDIDQLEQTLSDVLDQTG